MYQSVWTLGELTCLAWALTTYRERHSNTLLGTLLWDISPRLWLGAKVLLALRQGAVRTQIWLDLPTVVCQGRD